MTDMCAATLLRRRKRSELANRLACNPNDKSWTQASTLMMFNRWTLIACPGHITRPSTLNAARCFKVRRQCHLLVTHLRTAALSEESCMVCILWLLNAGHRCRPRIQGLGPLPLQRASHFSVCHYWSASCSRRNHLLRYFSAVKSSVGPITSLWWSLRLLCDALLCMCAVHSTSLWLAGMWHIHTDSTYWMFSWLGASQSFRVLGRHLAEYMHTRQRCCVWISSNQMPLWLEMKTGFLPGTLLGMLSLYHYDFDLNLNLVEVWHSKNQTTRTWRNDVCQMKSFNASFDEDLWVSRDRLNHDFHHQ